MYNESFGSSVKRGFMGLPIAIRTIIGLNLVVYLIQVFGQVFGGSAFSNMLIGAFAFYPELLTTVFQPWRLFTYMFLHAGAWHLVFNMLWLWWMGRSVEETLGPRSFTVIYLGSGIGGALLDVFFAQFLGINYVIGASGAVFGIMVAFAVLYPRMPIHLFLLPPVEARYVVAGLIALNLLALGGDSNVAHIVHLGGAGIGYLLMKARQGGFNLGGVIQPLENIWLELKGAYKKKESAPGNKDMYSVSDVEIIEEVEQSELDDILEKISEKGYDALTKEEKKKLFELSKKN
ncbi:MAG TPA: rhomboid family intramembrane serine protease [Halalkalibaculum sp.]|nr:rhomboid family intramembrane serine protease [Halalkalibaculum sp.]